MITAMTTSTILLIVIAVVIVAAYAAYLVSVIRDDGYTRPSRRPSGSHIVDPAADLSRLA